MREADIRPADLLNEYLRLSAQDAGRLFADPAERVTRDCPGCGGSDAVPAFDKNGFAFVRCRDCATLYVNPAPAPRPLADFYSDSPSQRYWARTFFPAVAEARRDKIFRPRVRRIAELTAAAGATITRLVDVGAGTGIFLEECRAAGLGRSLGAVEPNAPLAAMCRDKGFDTFEGFAGNAAGEAAWRDGADLVTCFEVIEHVLDAAGFIDELAKLVAPGGYLLITGLCGTGFDILALGRHAKAVSPPHHINFLSRDGAARLLARCGLKLVDFLTPGELDLDIVRNTDREAGGLPLDPFVRQLIDTATPETAAAFQSFLKENGLSSHMWIVARRPA